MRSTDKSRDEFDAQLQVALRNSEAPDALLWTLLGPGGLASTWHGHKRRAWLKCAALASAPSLIWAGFLVAGIFVGQIVTSTGTDSQMLLKAGDCGWLTPADPAGQDSALGMQHITINASSVAMQYARQCYQEDSLSAVSCTTWPKPTLSYQVDNDQPCPFSGEAVCFEDDDNAPIAMLSSRLDSHLDLGINAPNSGRLTLEKRATCAPLTYDFVDNHVRFTPNTDSDIAIEEYHFGSWIQNDFNTTYSFQYAPAVRQLGLNAVGYGVISFDSPYPHTSGSANWVPIAPFNQTSGDLSLILVLPNAVTFTSPVTDVMFQTNTEADPNLLGGAPYRPSRNVYALSCVEENQICNPNNGRCTGFQPSVNLTRALSGSDEDSSLSQLELSRAQNATASRLIWATVSASMFNAVHGVPGSLAAQGYLNQQTISQPVPETQWKREVQGWFEATLSKLQLLQNVWVDVPRQYVESHAVTIAFPDDIELQRQCHQQRVAATQTHQNYSFFAIALIAIMSVLTPVVSHSLPYLKHFLPACHPNGHRLVGWQAEGLLQLHRMAMEGAGYIGWEKQSADIPRTEKATTRLPQAHMDWSSEQPAALRYPYLDLAERDTKAIPAP